MAQNLSDSNSDWQIQKICTDVQDYELVAEKQKRDWNCEQTRESWKWIISYHGSVVASGSVNSAEEAKAMAMANLPIKLKEVPDSDCGCPEQ